MTDFLDLIDVGDVVSREESRVRVHPAVQPSAADQTSPAGPGRPAPAVPADEGQLGVDVVAARAGPVDNLPAEGTHMAVHQAGLRGEESAS